jgi:hypothetical protein
VKFCLCPPGRGPARPNTTLHSRRTPNGLEQKPTVLLCSHRNSPGHHRRKNALQCHPTRTTNGKYHDGHRLDNCTETPKPTNINWMRSTQVPQPNQGLHRRFHRRHPKHHHIAPLQFSRRIVDGITKVFPPPELSGSEMTHPILEKKLIEDGIWDTRKEILGWLFDGMARTIELPHHKCTELLLELKKIRRLPKLEVKKFQKLHGRLQFATIAIPCGKPILGQLYWYMASASKHPGRKLVVTDALKAILRDWSALIQLVRCRPTHVTELAEHPPAYQGFMDASKWGVGGVWFGGTKQLITIVWFYEWPQTIRNQFCSASNKTGSLTILDLELTGILLQRLVLEHVVDRLTLRDAMRASPYVATTYWQ